jgi:AraC-like DNA-binding protein
VGCFWYWKGSPQTHSKDLLLPNGEASVIFNLRDEAIRVYDAQDLQRYSTYGTEVFSGARSNCFVIDTSQEERVIGIQFRPGGTFPFFRAPASELGNSSVSLSDLWRQDAAEIRAQLLASPNVEAMFRVLERFLLRQAVRPLELHHAVRYSLRHFKQYHYTATVSEVVDRVGLSSRRFIELFREQVGLAPKAFCRVRRFQRVVQALHGRKETDGAQLALECGYYDQAHFIHDFQCFSGLTPSAYLARATPHLNHVPIP